MRESGGWIASGCAGMTSTITQLSISRFPRVSRPASRSIRGYDSTRVGMSAAAPIKSDCIDFLSLMTAPKRSQVLAGSTPITYPAGSVAYMPGQPDYASVIASGLARVYRASARGRQATVYYFHRGELVCKGLVPGAPVSVHVQ